MRALKLASALRALCAAAVDGIVDSMARRMSSVVCTRLPPLLLVARLKVVLLLLACDDDMVAEWVLQLRW
jgi:hypothetical protein